jgi:hypothetical protein
MTIRVGGVLDLATTSISGIVEERAIYFSIIKKALENNFFMGFEPNISEKFVEKFTDLKGKMLFELFDDPQHTSVHCLFNGEGVRVYCGSSLDAPDRIQIDTGESLATRLTSVQKFLTAVLKSKYFNGITLYINFLGMDKDKIETIEINVNDFCSTLLPLYQREGNYAPAVRIIMNKAKDMDEQTH